MFIFINRKNFTERFGGQNNFVVLSLGKNPRFFPKKNKIFTLNLTTTKVNLLGKFSKAF